MGRDYPVHALIFCENNFLRHSKAMHLIQSGVAIIFVQLVPIADGKWEIGYHVAKAFTGKGYATDAKRPESASGLRDVRGGGKSSRFFGRKNGLTECTTR